MNKKAALGGGDKVVKTELLRENIDKSGLKIQFLAKEIGITRQSLTSKIDGVHDFRLREAVKLSKLLGLTKAQRDTIFFS